MHLKAPVLKSFAWTKNGVTFTKRLYSCAAGVRQRSLSWPGSAEYSQGKQSLFHWILVSEVKVKGSYFINSVSHSPEMDALFCAGWSCSSLIYFPSRVCAKVQKENVSWKSPNSMKLFLNSIEKPTSEGTRINPLIVYFRCEFPRFQNVIGAG